MFTKSFAWSPATLFAPMEGVTHPPMRENMVGRGGLGIVCTEFVRVTSNPLGKKALEKHVVRPSRGALSVQVMGNDIAQMADATALVTGAGADIVDINLGCPAPRVVRKGVGSAMLKDTVLLGKVLSAMRKRTHLPLSAKIRAGFDDASGVLDVARVVQDSGCDFITVHPRRRVDFYQGVADWRIVRLLVDHLNIPVVGNGDVWYAADALRMQEETGCAAVMIGRPALRNPWIFRQIAELKAGTSPFCPTGADVVAYVEELRTLFTEAFPERSVTGLLKEQVRYIARTVDPATEYSKMALRAENEDQILRATAEVFGNLSADEVDLGAQSGRWERSGSAVTPEEKEPSFPKGPGSASVSAHDTARLVATPADSARGVVCEPSGPSPV